MVTKSNSVCRKRDCGIDNVKLLVDIRNFNGRLFSFGVLRRDRTVSIATGYGMNDRGLGVRVPVG
jgi:hypothetical protein